jgi:hypothetical protein
MCASKCMRTLSRRLADKYNIMISNEIDQQFDSIDEVLALEERA